MKRKIILMIILLCVIILGMPNVKAADEVEYKPGDLVEVINLTGGKSQQFYIIQQSLVNECIYYLKKSFSKI